MNDTGRLTVPAEARRALGLEGETEFEVEADLSHDALILRPVVTLLREDAWAYTPEHRATLRRARADARAGDVVRLTEAELLAIAEKRAPVPTRKHTARVGQAAKKRPSRR